MEHRQQYEELQDQAAAGSWSNKHLRRRQQHAGTEAAQQAQAENKKKTIVIDISMFTNKKEQEELPAREEDQQDTKPVLEQRLEILSSVRSEDKVETPQDKGMDEKQKLQSVLMSQFFVCSSAKQRMSMAKFMLHKEGGSDLKSNNSAGKSMLYTAFASPSLASPLRRTRTLIGSSTSKLDRELTLSLQKQIEKQPYHRDNRFDQEIIEEDLDEGVQSNVTRMQKAAGDPQVKMLSQIMRIGEYDLEEDLSENVNRPLMAKAKPLMGKDPLDFEALYMVGYNENYHTDDSPQDQHFYRSLKHVPGFNKRKVKPPQVMASVQN